MLGCEMRSSSGEATDHNLTPFGSCIKYVVRLSEWEYLLHSGIHREETWKRWRILVQFTRGEDIELVSQFCTPHITPSDNPNNAPWHNNSCFLCEDSLYNSVHVILFMLYKI